LLHKQWESSSPTIIVLPQHTLSLTKLDENAEYGLNTQINNAEKTDWHDWPAASKAAQPQTS